MRWGPFRYDLESDMKYCSSGFKRSPKGNHCLGLDELFLFGFFPDETLICLSKTKNEMPYSKSK